jgi:threonine/homoserine/homoserine lactone efflux protein
MDPSAALLAGLVAGLAIAMQVGAVSLLLIEASVAAGPRVGMAAGLGVATADLAFAAVAAAAGGTVGAALSSHETEIRVLAAVLLGAIAVHGLVTLARRRDVAGGTGERAAGDGGEAARDGGGAAGAHYVRFLGITVGNPLTIASFAAVAAALSLDGPLAAIAFAAGVGAASGAWHLVLTLAAGHAGRWMTPRVRRALGVAGRLAVLAIAAHLAFGG